MDRKTRVKVIMKGRQDRPRRECESRGYYFDEADFRARNGTLQIVKFTNKEQTKEVDEFGIKRYPQKDKA